MFRIPRVEKESYYIDKAMQSMQNFALKERENINERFEKSHKTKGKSYDEIRLNKRKDLELEKIKFLNEKLNEEIKKIIKKFPNFKEIDDIYIKLINTSQTKVKDILDAITRLLWIANSIDEFTQNSSFKIKKTRSQDTIGFIMKKYLGKVNSLFRKNKSYFKTLEQSRTIMNKMPTFLDIFTVSIAGFPNVGKSTLMSKISGSNVEIQNYPFTTKGLMFGYIKHGKNKTVQMIDTPGLLDRTDKANQIEERAKIIISQYSDLIVFVLDLTESCGYSVKNQIKLLKKTRDIGKPLLLYLSKTDIYDEEAEDNKSDIGYQLKKYTCFDDFQEIKDKILEEKSKIKKFDVKNIKMIR